MIQQHTADVDGTPVRWLEQGSGVVVVLVHGIPTSPALWRHVLPLLPGLRVLAFTRVIAELRRRGLVATSYGVTALLDDDGLRDVMGRDPLP